MIAGIREPLEQSRQIHPHQLTVVLDDATGDEHGVHVRRDDLLGSSRPRLLPGEAGAALEDMMNERETARIRGQGGRHPVAGAWANPGAEGRVAPELARQLRRMKDVRRGRDAKRIALLVHDAGGHEAARLEWMELRVEKRVPAQSVKRMQWRLLSFVWIRGEAPTWRSAERRAWGRGLAAGGGS